MAISMTVLPHSPIIERSILSTGLKVITKPFLGFNKSELIWSIPVGSRHSNASHFLYHSLLVGSTTRLSNLAITRLSELSGSPISVDLHRDYIFLKVTSPNSNAREDHVHLCADILQDLKIEDWQVDSIIRDRVKWDRGRMESDPQAFLIDIIHQISFREKGLEDHVTSHELLELLSKKIRTDSMSIFANHHNHEEFKAIVGKYWNTNAISSANIDTVITASDNASLSSSSNSSPPNPIRIGHRAEWRQYKSNLDRNYCILGFPKIGRPSPTIEHLLAYYLIDCTLKRLSSLVVSEFNYEITGQIHLYNDASLYTILFSQPNNDESNKDVMENYIKKSIETIKKIIRENGSVFRAKRALDFDQKDQSLLNLSLQWNTIGQITSNDYNNIDNSSIIKLALEILELNTVNYACIGNTRELPYLDDIINATA